MKNIKLVSCLGILLILVTACQKNLSNDLASDTWNHERGIMSIRLEHQLGDPVIVRDEYGSSEIKIYVNLQAMTSNELELQQLSLSYGATSDAQVGQKISFDNDNSATIRITSQSGQTRDWLVQLLPFDDPILGTWNIRKLEVYGGTNPSSGSTNVVNIGTLNLMNRTAPHLSTELDNILTFTLEGVEADGSAYGTLVHDPGPDETFGKFYITSGGGAILYDMNPVYRTIPEGTSTWRKNGVNGLITITSSEGVSHTSRFLGAQTVTLFQNDTHHRFVVVDNHALQFSIVQPKVTSPYGSFNTINYMGDNPEEYFIHIEKAN